MNYQFGITSEIRNISMRASFQVDGGFAKYHDELSFMNKKQEATCSNCKKPKTNSKAKVSQDKNAKVIRTLDKKIIVLQKQVLSLDKKMLALDKKMCDVRKRKSSTHNMITRSMMSI